MQNMIVTVIFFLLAVSVSGQQSGRGPRQQQQAAPEVQAATQQAQTITIQISADLATALESLRLNTRSAPVADPATGAVTQIPVHANLQALVNALLSSPGGLFDQVLKRYPSGSVKASQAALRKAQQDADAAEKAALPVIP
jgi:hypothetical protein